MQAKTGIIGVVLNFAGNGQQSLKQVETLG